MNFCFLFEQFSIECNKTKTKVIEQFSLESRKTRTKAITPATHNRRRHSDEPIETGSKYMSPVPSGKHVRASNDWFWFYF